MRILIAEDEEDLRVQYKEALELNDHNVILTNDGDECLEKYDAEFKKWCSSKEGNIRETPFDIVLLDYKMPKKDGLTTAKEILSWCPEQRIMFVSAYIESTLISSIKNLHQIVELLQKPFSIKTLIDKIEDKIIYEELKKMNVNIKNLKGLEPTHAQIRDYLEAFKTLQAFGNEQKINL